MYEYLTFENFKWLIILLSLLLLLYLFRGLLIDIDYKNTDIINRKFNINKIYEYPNMLSDEQINEIIKIA